MPSPIYLIDIELFKIKALQQNKTSTVNSNEYPSRDSKNTLVFIELASKGETSFNLPDSI